MRAYKAAQARAAMSPEQRARAVRRWKDAARRVLSPSQKVKRAMRDFATTKVNKNQTVVSRVERIEEENKEYEKRLHQLEKVVKKLQAKQLKDAALEYKLRKRVKALAADGRDMGSGLLQLKEALVGAHAQVAEAILGGDKSEEERAAMAPIVSSGEASSAATVSARLKAEAEQEGTPKELAVKVRARALPIPSQVISNSNSISLVAVAAYGPGGEAREA